MEILLKQGDRLPIPEGCKAVINDGVVVFEKENTEFNDGDIVSVTDVWGDTDIFILKYRDSKGFNYYYIALSSSGNLVQKNSDDEYWGNITPVLATEEEKQLLFAKMKEQGLRWNAEEKKVEKIKWEPTNGETYFFVNQICKIASGYFSGDDFDRKLLKLFNIFRTPEQAEKAAEVVKEALRKFHEENG